MKTSKVNWQRILPIIFSALSAVISLLTTFFVAKILKPEAYGEVQGFVGVIQVLSIIAALGLPDFLTKSAQYAENKKAFFSKYFLLVCCWSVIVFPTFFAIAYFFMNMFGNNIILIIVTALAAFAQCVALLIGGFYLGIYKQAKGILFENLLPKFLLLILSLGLIFILKAYSNNSSPFDEFSKYYVYGFFAIYGVISIIFISILLRKTSFKFTKKEILTILAFFALNATYSLNTALGKVIGSEFYHVEDVGAFALSAQLVTLATLFVSVITSMSKPVFSSLANDKEKLILYFQKITRINSFIVIPFCVGFMVQSKSLLSLVDSSYAPYFLILILMSAGTLFANVTGPNGSMLAMANHEKIEIVNGIINIAVFVICAFAFRFIDQYLVGGTGLALATLVAVFLVNLIKLIEIRIVYKTNPYPLKLTVHLLILIAVSALVFFLIDFIPNYYVKIAIDCVVGLALIVGGFVVNPYKDDKYFFSNRSV